MTRRRASWLFVVPMVGLLALAAVVVLASKRSSASDSEATIALPSFADMVADEAHGHVFFTGCPGTDTIVLTDLNGAVVTTRA